MGIIEIILTTIGSSLLAGIGSAFYFSSNLKEAKAKAQKVEVEAFEQKSEYLEKRISSMEKMYAEQGVVLDSLRQQLLIIGREKFENEQRIVFLEAENKKLQESVNKLEKEVNLYRAQMRKKGLIKEIKDE